MPASLDVLTVGNALVDVLSRENDEFLDLAGVVKNSMTMVDQETALRIYDLMGPATEVSGGSAANTAVGVAAFGGNAGFIGRTRDDQVGEFFRHDIEAAGVHCAGGIATTGESTGRSYIIVTPDAHRTMCTYLGAANQLEPSDVTEGLVESATITYIEGYLWDQPAAKDAIRVIGDRVAAAGNKFAFTLSDSFCVDRNRADFLDLIEHRFDIVFANEAELCALFETDQFDTALAAIRARCDLVAVTRSEKGSILAQGAEVAEIPAAPADVVDTTGAGDLYAAGVLFGLTHGMSLAEAGRHGALAASEVIAHVGARPVQDLKTLV